MIETLLVEDDHALADQAFLKHTLRPGEAPESDPLRTHIYRLRQVLDRPFKPELIKTVHGRGYRLAITE